MARAAARSPALSAWRIAVLLTRSPLREHGRHFADREAVAPAQARAAPRRCPSDRRRTESRRRRRRAARPISATSKLVDELARRKIAHCTEVRAEQLVDAERVEQLEPLAKPREPRRRRGRREKLLRRRLERQHERRPAACRAPRHARARGSLGDRCASRRIRRWPRRAAWPTWAAAAKRTSDKAASRLSRHRLGFAARSCASRRGSRRRSIRLPRRRRARRAPRSEPKCSWRTNRRRPRARRRARAP